jgi:hypothetical protein
LKETISAAGLAKGSRNYKNPKASSSNKSKFQAGSKAGNQRGVAEGVTTFLRRKEKQGRRKKRHTAC